MSNSLRAEASASRSRLFRARASAAALGSLLAATPATATEPDAPDAPTTENANANLDLARSIAVTGREAFNAGDYETALALFRRAYTLYPAPTVVLYEARTLEKMGLLLEAGEAYVRTTQIPIAADAPEQFAEAIAAARQEERSLSKRIPTLTLRVDGVSGNDPHLKVSVNGRAIGAAQLGQAQRLNPGTYRISGSLSPDRSDEAEVRLAEGQNASLVLRLGAASPAPPAPAHSEIILDEAPSAPGSLQLYAYVAGGVGLAGLGAGVVTGLMAVGKHAEAEGICKEHLCPLDSSGPNTLEEFRSLRTLSSICYGVGAAGIAAGVVLWLISPDAPEAGQAHALAPWSDAHSVGVQGQF